MSSLLAIRGPLTGLRCQLAEVAVLGRGEGCDIVLPDAEVSRQHARLVRKGLGYILEDIESRHGTFVNNASLAGPRSLRRNDELRIGKSIFLFDSDLDVQNADFSDRSVFLAAPQDETVAVPAVATLDAPADLSAATEAEAADLIVRMGTLFDSTKVSFADALNATGVRLASMFAADIAIILLWDSAQDRLRPSVVVSEDRNVVTDAGVLSRVVRERRSVLLSDRAESARQLAPEAGATSLMRSLLAVPLEIDQAILGVLYLERREADAYSLKQLKLAQAVGRLLALFIEARQKAEALALRANFAVSESPLVGSSAKLRRAMELVARVAPSETPVLLVGETGTGKELLARELHRQSRRGKAGAPFVAVNCAAIPESLFESHLFGHEKGSFTGADRTHRGLVEQANGGTLFLDEIGEMPPLMQPKLLRFLQDHLFTRVGGTSPIRADVRIVAATNRQLQEEMREHRFREDLYHRLAVIEIPVPPLRERPEDIRPLAEHFVVEVAKRDGRPVLGITDDAAILLEKHAWPGNVRELVNCIERAVLLCDDKVLLPRHLLLPEGVMSRRRAAPMQTLAQVEREHIERVLASTGGNQVAAAEVLGIHRNTLRKKLEEYGG